MSECPSVTSPHAIARAVCAKCQELKAVVCQALLFLYIPNHVLGNARDCAATRRPRVVTAD